MSFRDNLFKVMFFLSYLSYMIYSVYYVRENGSLSNYVMVFRALIYASALAAWVVFSLSRKISSEFIWVVILCLLPYVLTDSWKFFLDIVSISIFASAIKEMPDRERLLIGVSYLSVIFVIFVVVLSSMGYLPSEAFAWKGTVKEAFGFKNPNTIYFFLFSSSMVFFVFRHNIGIVVCGAIMLALYPFVQNRAFMLGYLIMIPAYFLLTIYDGRLIRMVLWSWLLFVLVLGIVTSIYPLEAAVWSLQNMGVDLDDLLSSRLTVVQGAVFGLSFLEILFGGWVGEIDSMFIYFFSGVGLIGFLIFIAFVAFHVVKMNKRYGSFILLFSCIFFTVGLVESPFDGTSLISFMFIYLLFFDNQSLKKWRPQTMVTSMPATAPRLGA